jgi:hypothetical protein
MIPLSTTSDQGWQTPEHVYDYARSRWGAHEIDMCAAGATISLCQAFVGPEGRTIYEPPPIERWLDCWWCNPPWGATKQWTRRAIEALHHGRSGTLLVRADLSTEWAYELYLRGRIVVLTPRVAYVTGGRASSAPCGSMLVRLEPGLLTSADKGVQIVRLEVGRD